jgi:hypothetical protein
LVGEAGNDPRYLLCSLQGMVLRMQLIRGR